MKFDDLAAVWQEQNDRPLSPEDRELMIARVCRRVERFWGGILRRDVREIAVAVVLIVVFGRWAIVLDNLISRIGCGFLVLSMLFIIWKLHRARTIQRPAPIDAPVREFCQVELDRLDRQIQLLRSVLWWYIAPLTVGANIVYVGMNGLGIDSLFYAIVTLLLACFLYQLNLLAVTTGLVPLRNELAHTLNQLEGAEPCTLPPAGQPAEDRLKHRHFLFGIAWFVVFAAVGLVGAYFASQEVDYPKRAPFSGIRWEEGEPVVKIGEEWVMLVSIDGIPVQDIVAFSQRRYLLRWQKRFEEDLVEVLTRMGHEPGETVQLMIRPLGSSETRTLDDVPMTEANRRTIYRERRQQ